VTVTLDVGSLSRTDKHSPSSPMGMGCIGLFLLPFAVVGVVTAASGVQRVAQGHWREGGMLVLFGLVFAGFAAAGMAAAAVGWRKLKEQERLKAAHPDQPWLWQADWARGHIADNNRATLWTSWIFAIFWNLVAIPVGVVGVLEAVRDGNHAGYVALLFPLVGAGILAWAIRSTLRHVKYGVSRLALDTVPGVIGRSLAGTVRISSLLRSDDGFDATLSCLRRVTTRSGENSSTSETILWQEEQRVPGEPSRDPSGLGTRIPVSFRIPADAQASDSSNARDQIVWRLRLSASVPGVDYESTFEVPVFRTSASAQPLGEDELRVAGKQSPQLSDYRQPPDSRITVTRNRRGTEILFPAARNPGVAIGSTVFTLLWTAVVAAVVHFDAPVIFTIVFGAFELLLIVGTLSFWLMVSRVRAEAGRLDLAGGYLFCYRERSFTASEIADVSTRIGMQAGSRPYYDIMVDRKSGKPATAGRWIRDKREAEWLAGMMKDVVGLKS
jgi:hypothetical protein